MNRVPLGFALCALPLLGACATVDDARNRPFTPEWEDRVRGDQAFRQRQDRIRGDGGRGLVQSDERGRPQVGVGGRGESGVTGGVGVDQGPSGQLGYRHKWDFAKPPRRNQ